MNFSINDPEEKQDAKDYIDRLSKFDDITIEIRQTIKPSSYKQKGYYKKYLMPTAAIEFGYDLEELEIFFISEYLNGNDPDELNTKDREIYHFKIRKFAAQQGILLNLPGDVKNEEINYISRQWNSYVFGESSDKSISLKDLIVIRDENKIKFDKCVIELKNIQDNYNPIQKDKIEKCKFKAWSLWNGALITMTHAYKIKKPEKLKLDDIIS